MSHYSLLVALPHQLDINTEDGRGFLDEVMGLYDENNENAISPKWDWYSIGGRWVRYFRFKENADPADLVSGHPSWISRGEELPDPSLYCDGGRIHALDLQRMRNDAADKAEKDWNQYASVIDGTPERTPWSDYTVRVREAEIELFGCSWHDVVDGSREVARAHLGLPITADAFYQWLDEEAEENWHDTPTGMEYSELSGTIIEGLKSTQSRQEYTFEMARDDYHNQPRVKAVHDHPEYEGWLFDDPTDRFDRLTRDEYIEQQRARAVSGFAFLYVTSDDLDCRRYHTQWIAPGEMGWFGMSTDTDDSRQFYHKRVNDIIDSLRDTCSLICVDCHI